MEDLKNLAKTKEIYNQQLANKLNLSPERKSRPDILEKDRDLERERNKEREKEKEKEKAPEQ